MTAESTEQALGALTSFAPSCPPAARESLGHVLPLRRGALGFYQRGGKRAVDVVGSATMLLLLAPLMLAVAAAVAVSLGRPVLFRQERVGRGGSTFTVLKFRTMRPDRRGPAARAAWDGSCRRQTHKSDVDPRHTGAGRLLRRTSLDELPQLWNVLVGDMSLVGPRPELVSVVGRYAPWQHRRHDVRPGLTGLWQISARGDKPMHEVTHIDIEYVQRQSLGVDLRILLGTPAALLRRGGS